MTNSTCTGLQGIKELISCTWNCCTGTFAWLIRPAEPGISLMALLPFSGMSSIGQCFDAFFPVSLER